MANDLSNFTNGISSFGVPVLGSGGSIVPASTGSYFFVHSGTGSNINSGKSPSKAVASIDTAIGLCTANKGDVIVVMPGHAESVTAAGGIDADVAGITILGLGNDENRPVITFTTATTADFDIDAANITIRNLVFKNDIDSQAIMIDVNSTGATIEGCAFYEGSSKQWLTAIDINGGSANACDRATIRGNRFTATTAGPDCAIGLDEVADRVLIEGNIIDGDFSDAGIHNPTGKVLTNLIIRNNVIRNRQTGDHAIELVSACTGELVDNRLCADTVTAILDPGSLFCTGNLGVTQIDGHGFAVPPPVDFIPGLGYKVTKSHNLATDNVDLFTVTGRVAINLLVGEVTTVVGGAATYLIRVKTANTNLFAATTIDSAAVDTLIVPTGDAGDAGSVVVKNADFNGKGGYPKFIVGSLGDTSTLESDMDAADTGVIRWDLYYFPLDADAKVVAA